MNLETMAARCRGCQSLVDLRAGPSTAPDRGPLPVPLPDQITVAEAEGELRIERRWFTWMAIFLAVFCVFWFGFLAFWYAIAIASRNVPAMLFPLLHVAAGLFILYSAVAMFVNRTWIVVSAGRLTVRHGPLPWIGNHDLGTSTLEQLYCDQHVSRSRNGVTVTFEVLARTTDGKRVKLVRGLPERDQARYIEQEIERHLGIVDRPVGAGWGV
jgi:hypothetical protein